MPLFHYFRHFAIKDIDISPLFYYDISFCFRCYWYFDDCHCAFDEYLHTPYFMLLPFSQLSPTLHCHFAERAIFADWERRHFAAIFDTYFIHFISTLIASYADTHYFIIFIKILPRWLHCRFHYWLLPAFRHWFSFIAAPPHWAVSLILIAAIAFIHFLSILIIYWYSRLLLIIAWLLSHSPLVIILPFITTLFIFAIFALAARLIRHSFSYLRAHAISWCLLATFRHWLRFAPAFAAFRLISMASTLAFILPFRHYAGFAIGHADASAPCAAPPMPLHCAASDYIRFSPLIFSIAGLCFRHFFALIIFAMPPLHTPMPLDAISIFLSSFTSFLRHFHTPYYIFTFLSLSLAITRHFHYWYLLRHCHISDAATYIILRPPLRIAIIDISLIHIDCADTPAPYAMPRHADARLRWWPLLSPAGRHLAIFDIAASWYTLLAISWLPIAATSHHHVFSHIAEDSWLRHW